MPYFFLNLGDVDTLLLSASLCVELARASQSEKNSLPDRTAGQMVT